MKIIKKNGIELIFHDALQTLMIKESGKLRRTINGKLVHTGMPGFQKYISTIEISSFGGDFKQLAQGEPVTLWSGQRLTQSGNKKLVILDRPAVKGSVIAMKKGQMIPVIQKSNVEIELMKDADKGHEITISYEPILEMAIMGWAYKADEWGEVGQIKITLEEI